MRVIVHEPLYQDPDAYCSHPHMVAAADGTWLLAFNRSVRRPVTLHPQQDPEYCNLLMVSRDEGRSWSDPSPVPRGGIRGVECPGLTATRNGRIVLNQWRFQWHAWPGAHHRGSAEGLTSPKTLARSIARRGDAAGRKFPMHLLESVITCARGDGELRVHLSDDGGRTFPRSRRVKTHPFCGGYGMRGAIELPDGGLLLPLSDPPLYRAVFHVCSNDCGENWSAPTLIAEEPGKEFEEPAGLLVADSRILLLLRENRSGVLHRTVSDDGGRTWSRPAPTGIRDYPAQLFGMQDGNIACVAGRRFEPYGIMLHVSADGGMTWNPDWSIALRDDLESPDLGYPTVCRRQSGELFVVYYAQDREGVTGLHSTTFSASELR